MSASYCSEELLSFTDLIRAAAIRAAEKVNRQAEVDGSVEGANLAYERLARFEPEIGIQYGGQAPLVTIPAVSPAPTACFKCEAAESKPKSAHRVIWTRPRRHIRKFILSGSGHRVATSRGTRTPRRGFMRRQQK
jgi:hypothetical protein